jgi:hypothetical protein
MKLRFVISALAALAAAVAYCQPPRDDGEGGPPPGRPPRDPFLQLFDTDQDGEISTREIENAGKILKQLDRDGNGVLTPDELPRPPRPNDRGRGRGRDEQRDPRRDQEGGGRAPKAERTEKQPVGSVIFEGGYETDPQDHGRPVALIAAALGMKEEVFRQAFSGVTPARGGGPTPERARDNKKVLMDALGKYGVTNDRLDTVSNYYRYNGAAGEVWKRSAATAKAVIKDGKVTGISITNAGAGYTTPPTVTVAGYDNVKVQATIEFSQDFAQNGRLKTLKIVGKDQ